MTQSTELEQLFPSGKEVSIQNTAYVIKPFKFGELPKVFKIIQPISGALASVISGGLSVESVSTLLADGGDSIIDLIVLGSKQPKAWIEELDMDEGVNLLISVIEVNSDFFIHKVLPNLNATMATVNGQQSS